MTQQITQHKVTDSKKPNECELSTKVTLRKIGRILMIVQNNIVELLRREGKWDQADVEAAMRDSNVKQVVQKNVKSGNIVFVHRESNEPVFQREMSLIGEKGDRAANESPNGEDSQLQVDPEQANLVSFVQANLCSM